MAPSPEVLSSKNRDQISSTCAKYKLSVEQFEELRARSVEAKAVAYCPYSNFRVGCALLTADGSVVTGANVENAAYPVGTCAERVTIGKAVTEGHRGKYKAIAVATDISPPASPCGMCRQLYVLASPRRRLVFGSRTDSVSSIREFCDLKMPILMFDQNLDYVAINLEDVSPVFAVKVPRCVSYNLLCVQLLPLSFGPEHLQVQRGS